MGGAVKSLVDLSISLDPTGTVEPTLNIFGINTEDGEREGPETPTFTASLKDRFITTKQPVAPRRIVYGQARIGGVYTFLETTGNSNEFFHIVITLSGKKLNAITGMFFDGEELPLSGNDVTGRYAGKVNAYFNLGGVNQEAIPALVAAVPDKWTTAHRQRGCAHVYVRLEFDKDLFPSGLPNIKFDVQGFDAVFDPRTSTTGYTANAALCVADYIADPVFGFGAEYSTEILDADLIEAANICDEAISLEAGGTEARYELHGVLSTATTPQDNLKALLSAMAGRAISRGVVWLIRAGAYRSPEISLTEDDMVGPVGFKTLRPKDKLFNSGQGVFVSPGNDWIPGDYPTVTVPSYVTSDNGEEIWRDFEYKFTISPTAAQRMTRQAIELNRRQITGTLSCKSRAYQIVARDTFNLTFERYGWDEKTFMAESVSLVQRGGATVVEISFSEIDAGAYSWDSSFEGDPIPANTTNLPSPFTIVAPTLNTLESGTGQFIVTGTGAVVSRIRATWTVNDPYATRTEVQSKKSAEPTWAGLFSSTQDAEYYVTPAEDGVKYDFRIRSVNGFGVSSEWVEELEHVVVGKTEPPPNVANLFIEETAQNVRRLWWTELSRSVVPDLAGYDVRYNRGSSTSWSSATRAHNGVLPGTPFEITGLPAGAITLLVSAVDTSGNVSISPSTVATFLGGRVEENIVQTVNYNPLWLGTITGGAVVAGELVADDLNVMWAVGGSLYWGGDDSALEWSGDGIPVFSGDQKEVWTGDSVLFWSDTYPELTYQDVIIPEKNGLLYLNVEKEGPLELYYRIPYAGLVWTDDGALRWMDDSSLAWTRNPILVPWTTPVFVTQQEVDVIAKIQAGPVKGIISVFSAVVDMPDVKDRLTDISILTAGTRLPVISVFDTVKNIQLTVQDDGGGGVSAVELDRDPAGPLIKVLNSSGAAVDGTINAIVQGF